MVGIIHTYIIMLHNTPPSASHKISTCETDNANVGIYYVGFIYIYKYLCIYIISVRPSPTLFNAHECMMMVTYVIYNILAVYALLNVHVTTFESGRVKYSNNISTFRPSYPYGCISKSKNMTNTKP